jgi:hypothetical protein
MSASAWSDRPKNPATPRPDAEPSRAERRWVGLDFSGANDPRRAKALIPLLLLAVITALGVAALRIDLIRTRYAVAAATEAESMLIEERRALTARRRQLRDPMVLAVEARERGFRPPTHVFSLPDPAGASRTPPAVAAGSREGPAR